ncbi:MAG: IclR family transcriptional regulator [Lachnospiraceae bacterium]
MVLQSLDRGLEALKILAEHDSVSVTELAKKLDVNKSTASRIMETLCQQDMIHMDKKTRKYKLGFRVLHLAERFRSSLQIIDTARPILLEVSRELGQSVHLCAYSRGMVYVIDQIVSDLPYSMSAMVGLIEPIHSSSVGKCIFAHRSQKRIEEILEDYEFTRYTIHTITDKEKLLNEFEKIRNQGYAVDNEEMFIGVRCIAVPVFRYLNSVRYGIGISGPIDLMSPKKLEIYRKRLVAAAKKIMQEVDSKKILR